MYDYTQALEVSGNARQAYNEGNYEEAVKLAKEAMSLAPWPDVAHTEAKHTLRFAKRHLDHPNPSWLRRLWWFFDGEWAIAFGGGSSLESDTG